MQYVERTLLPGMDRGGFGVYPRLIWVLIAGAGGLLLNAMAIVWGWYGVFDDPERRAAPTDVSTQLRIQATCMPEDSVPRRGPPTPCK